MVKTLHDKVKEAKTAKERKKLKAEAIKSAVKIKKYVRN